jgi:hypothetical protein
MILHRLKLILRPTLSSRKHNIGSASIKYSRTPGMDAKESYMVSRLIKHAWLALWNCPIKGVYVKNWLAHAERFISSMQAPCPGTPPSQPRLVCSARQLLLANRGWEAVPGQGACKEDMSDIFHMSKASAWHPYHISPLIRHYEEQATHA